MMIGLGELDLEEIDLKKIVHIMTIGLEELDLDEIHNSFYYIFFFNDNRCKG